MSIASDSGDTNAFALEGVTLSFGDASPEKTVALDAVTLNILQGQWVCILGANGSGKSTLASVLCGLLAPDAGQVTLVGEKCLVDGHVMPDAYRRARREIGLVFQNPEDQLITSVIAQELAFGPENLCFAPTTIDAVVARELARAHLTDRAADNPSQLSGGQKQRVATAATLTMNPSAVVFDEPGALLDVRGRANVMQVLKQLHAQGATVVHVTHFMEEALAAERTLVLDAGRIVFDGTPDQLFSDYQTVAHLNLDEPFAARVSRQIAPLLHGTPITRDSAWFTSDTQVLATQIVQATRNLPAQTAEKNQLFSAIPHKKPCKIETVGQSGVAAHAKSHVLSTTQPATQNEPIVRFEHVSFSYESAGQTRKALEDISFSLERGSSCALIGHTGSGKSTLLRLLCALEVPDAGTVEVAGISSSTRRGRRAIHGQVGYVMQRPERQLFGTTIFEDVAFGPKNQGLSGAALTQRVHEALELVGLNAPQERSPFELSGGQKRLCALAGILAMHPQLLVLDEPTAGLDPAARKNLLELLGRIQAQGTTILQVTHSMDDAAYCNKVLVLDRSRLILQGSPHEVFTPATAATLASCGLGIPAALTFATALTTAHVPGLANPLTEPELVAQLQALLGTSAPAEKNKGGATYGA